MLSDGSKLSSYVDIFGSLKPKIKMAHVNNSNDKEKRYFYRINMKFVKLTV